MRIYFVQTLKAGNWELGKVGYDSNAKAHRMVEHLRLQGVVARVFMKMQPQRTLKDLKMALQGARA